MPEGIVVVVVVVQERTLRVASRGQKWVGHESDL
jgi:hypothetical protein